MTSEIQQDEISFVLSNKTGFICSLNKNKNFLLDLLKGLKCKITLNNNRIMLKGNDEWISFENDQVAQDIFNSLKGNKIVVTSIFCSQPGVEYTFESINQCSNFIYHERKYDINCYQLYDNLLVCPNRCFIFESNRVASNILNNLSNAHNVHVNCVACKRTTDKAFTHINYNKDLGFNEWTKYPMDSENNNYSSGSSEISDSTKYFKPFGWDFCSVPSNSSSSVGRTGFTGPTGATGPSYSSNTTDITEPTGYLGPTGSYNSNGKTGSTGFSWPGYSSTIIGQTGSTGYSDPSYSSNMTGKTGSTGYPGPSYSSQYRGYTCPYGPTGPSTSSENNCYTTKSLNDYLGGKANDIVIDILEHKVPNKTNKRKNNDNNSYSLRSKIAKR